MEILWKCEKKENYFDGNVMELWKCENQEKYFDGNVLPLF